MSDSITVSQISPTLLHCHTFPDDYGFTLENFPKLPLRRALDYELEIILTDGGYMLVGNDKFHMQRGAVVFRRPGTKTNALNPYRCISVIIDMLGHSCYDENKYSYNEPRQKQYDYKNPVLDCILPYTVSNKSEHLIRLFENIRNELEPEFPHTPLIMRAYILEILAILYEAAAGQDNLNNLKPFMYHKAVQKTIKYINMNYAEKITLKELSAYVNLNADYLSRLFINFTGTKISQYIQDTRMQKAKELLIFTDLTIGEIACRCGFKSMAYFSCVFKHYFNETPGNYRKRQVWL